MKIIFGTEKKEIIRRLEHYGIEKVPFLLIRYGKDKIRGYSGALSKEEIFEINRLTKKDLIGIYLFNDERDEIRLSLDALHLFKDQITKSILDLNDEQAKAWFMGEELPSELWKNEKTGFKVIRNRGDFIGCGKLVENRLINYLPKE